MKIKEKAVVLWQEKLAEGVYSLTLETNIVDYAVPGQFISIFSNDGSKLLPRPISICEINKDYGTLRVVYRVVGAGTEEFSQLKMGDKVEVMGPLGNGFPLEGRNAIVVGGGIGVPPMLELAKQLPGKVTAVMGYRNNDLFLTEEFEKAVANLYIATDDGSVGVRGTVVDAMRENDLVADVIYACGPKPMLRAVADFALENQIKCYVSMEERMACGVGACLGCVCKSKETDEHSHVNNKRVCKDGPVFLSTEVVL
ncbi:dihydroorotate dehydrogenase electron transfer subunit [Pseudobutyrivibrio xylanivorans]|uniref:Dihydroorotate dehydrogenase B (NAD(+)), electron transfer subunit n=1 Tax=Pseudobutyrivibrio xylanivorans DSM 14809 TaxID=1123012 RepID=A0A1M6G7D6_PSEXY|nr:dihydroorotate dehydrogenase electron transfer subunit [Pseudobutyrivibrio xylanivorans]SHJ05856.1 dihydroorotate dehydrogenase electron transfer subunit [Pseudobutyrivibrio xylanivorans DSM 14809]